MLRGIRNGRRHCIKMKSRVETNIAIRSTREKWVLSFALHYLLQLGHVLGDDVVAEGVVL